jgi:hypothetical protein
MSPVSSNTSLEERNRLYKNYVLLPTIKPDCSLEKYFKHAKELSIAGTTSFKELEKKGSLTSAYIANKKVQLCIKEASFLIIILIIIINVYLYSFTSVLNLF